MFPPKKPGSGPPKKSGPSFGGPPQGGPPGGGFGGGGDQDLMALLGGQGGGDLGGMPMAGLGGPPGGGLPPLMGPGVGMPPPGSGMNAMSAMNNGLGMAPPPAPMGVNGPGGFPIGGSDPGQVSPGDAGGSDLLSMLSMGGGSDPYDQPPDAHPLVGMGTPPSGLEGLLSMLAMAQAGIDPNAVSPMGGQGMGMGMGGPAPY